MKTNIKHNDCVYNYQFEDGSIYIGRTIHKRTRDREHHSHKDKDSVYSYAVENNIAIPKMEIIEDNLTIEEGIEREKFWIKYYRDKDYNVINKTDGGETVSFGYSVWNYDKVLLEAKKYNTRKDFLDESPQAYRYAYEHGFLELFDWLPRFSKWNRENVIEESKKYTRRSDFQRYSKGAYKYAKRNGMLDKLFEPNQQSERRNFKKHKWDYDSVKEEALKYQTISQMEKHCKGGAAYIRRNNLLDDIFPNRGNVSERKWNLETVKEASKECNNRTEMHKKYYHGWLFARNHNILDELFSTKEISQKWYDKSVIEEGRKYPSRNQFRKHCRGAYNYADRNGLLNEIFQ